MEIPQQAISDIEEGQRLRGWITNSYAQIEFLLGDLIIRSRAFAEYELHTNTMRHDAKNRIKKVRNILKFSGPLDAFAERLTHILDRFESGHETRNLLADGFCEYLFTANGDAALQFQKWHRQPDRDDARLIRQFRMPAMRSEMELFSKQAQDAMVLFYEIHEHFDWTARPDK